MTVRRGRSGDKHAVESLQRFVSHPSPDLLDAWPAVGTLFVSVDDRDWPVGYLLAVGTHLTELAVSDNARREGRATALIEAYRAAQPDATLTLLVHPENDGARACYEALGFRRDDRISGAFGSDDGIRLVLDSV